MDYANLFKSQIISKLKKLKAQNLLRPGDIWNFAKLFQKQIWSHWSSLHRSEGRYLPNSFLRREVVGAAGFVRKKPSQFVQTNFFIKIFQSIYFAQVLK
jgi:hypothetical protein